MAQKIKFPYQNIALTNLPGEKWKDIPNYVGYYQISNYGRAKSLQRYVPTETGKIYHLKEKIRRVSVVITRNKTVNQPRYHVSIGLCRDHEIYNFSIARLVYHIFIKQFDLSDNSILISHKDYDGRNTHASNLKRTDFKKIIETSYKMGRTKNTFTPISVTQFDHNGKPVAHYSGAEEAAKETGIVRRSISAAAHGKLHTYKGYFWRFGIHNRKLKLNAITQKPQPISLIHDSLRKRLGIKKTDPDAIPAFLNLSPKSMKGERWKDVPGYQGLYQASSYGRVKALQKITFGKIQQWRPEKIQRLVVDFHATKTHKEVPGTTVVNMSKNGIKKIISVPRLIYFLFVAEFNRKDPTLNVYYKDGNSLNLNYKNLILKNVETHRK